MADSPSKKHRSRSASKKKKTDEVMVVVADPYPADSVDPSETTVTRVRCTWEFAARNDKELSMKPGDIIVVTAQQAKGEGWWGGRIGTREGLVPVNRVEVYEVLVKKKRNMRVNREKVSNRIKEMQRMISKGAVEEEEKKEEETPKSKTPPQLSPSPAHLKEASNLSPSRRRRVSVKLAEKDANEYAKEATAEEDKEESDDDESSSELSSSSILSSSEEEGSDFSSDEEESSDEEFLMKPIKFTYDEFAATGALVDSKIPKSSRKKTTFIINSTDGEVFNVSATVAGEVGITQPVTLSALAEKVKRGERTTTLDLGVVHKLIKVILTLDVEKVLAMIGGVLG